MKFEDLQKRLVEELSLEHLSPDEQEKVLDEIGGMLYQRVMLELFNHIPEGEHTKLKQLIDAGLEEEITALIHKHVPNVEEAITKELEQSMQEYKEVLYGTDPVPQQ